MFRLQVKPPISESGPVRLLSKQGERDGGHEVAWTVDSSESSPELESLFFLVSVGVQ